MAAIWATTSLAGAAECDGSYLAADDTPLARPAKDFSKMLRKARAGDPVEQRSLAASYEIGYLVSPCPKKALYWYKKAAAGGDGIAQEWLRRRQERIAFAEACPWNDVTCGVPVKRPAADATKAAPSQASPPGAGRPAGSLISLDTFKLIQPGMSYKTVSGILRAPGKELDRNRTSDMAGVLRGADAVTYEWAAASGAKMRATFENDKLTSKSQSGLE